MKQFLRGSTGNIILYTSLSFSLTIILSLMQWLSVKKQSYSLENIGMTADSNADNQTLMGIVILISVLLLINIINVTVHWVYTKNGEIRARIISGGTMKKICAYMNFNYAVIETVAICFGFILGCVVIGSNMLQITGLSIMETLPELLLSLFVVWLVGFSTSGSVIQKSCKTLFGGY